MRAWCIQSLAQLLLGLALSGHAMPADGPSDPGAILSAGLQPGAATEGAVTAEMDEVVYPLEAGTGDFVQGELLVQTGSADLDLLDAEGRPVRRLVEKGTGRNDFLFLAEKGAKLRVRGTAESASYRLQITKRIAPSGQVPPAITYLSPAIAALAKKIRAGGDTRDFWNTIEASGTPLVEPAGEGMRTVTFLYRGARKNVRILGAPSADHDPLENLQGSDVWFKSYTLPDTSRLSYKLAPDVPDFPGTPRERRVAILATAQADPLNRVSWPADAGDRFNRSSVLALDRAPDQPFVPERGAAGGTLEQLEIESARLGNTRRITLYRSPGFNPADPDAVLLFLFDGDAYQTKVPVPRILDNMRMAKAIAPVLAVFVPNPDRDARARELPGNPDFASFMAAELLPQVLAVTGMKAKPERTVLAGSSFGGLAAVTVALARPDLFGNALSMSGSFWWHPEGVKPEDSEYVAATLAKRPKVNLRVFLSAGLFEFKRPGPDAGILDSNRHLRDVLTARGYPVEYREYAAGHDYLAWQGILSDGLIALFGTP